MNSKNKTPDPMYHITPTNLEKLGKFLNFDES